MDLAVAFFYKKSNRYGFNALAGALESRREQELHELPLFFFRTEEELLSGVKELSEKHSKVVVALSFFTTQVWDVEPLVASLRATASNLFLVAGGPHPTGMPEKTLSMGFDAVCYGEGEETFPELLLALLREKELLSVKGLWLSTPNGPVFTGRRRPVELGRYLPVSFKYRKFGPIEISRGCPYVCYYCQTPFMFGARQRHRPLEQVVEVISRMREFGLKDFRFITPNAFSYGSEDGKSVNLEALREFLAETKRAAGPGGRVFLGSFPSEVRPEHVTEETVSLVKEFASNDNLVIGAQSGSDRVLKLCHRGHTVEDVVRAVKVTVKAGLKANVDFIFGLPGETEEDVLETVKVMRELVKLGARVHAHTFMPLPQTPFAGKPAGKVHRKMEKLIRELLPSGVIFGNWREQELLAQKIERYLRR